MLALGEKQLNAFTVITQQQRQRQRQQTYSFHTSSITSIQAVDSQINGDASPPLPPPIKSDTNDSDMTETIRKDSIDQYEQAMEYFMFELGNDIVFLSDQSEVSSYIQQRFDTIIFDCDGVLYRGGNNAIPECSHAIQSLMKDQQEPSKQILFLTNNAEYSRQQLCDKLTTIVGCEEGLLTEEQMITSSYSSAKYLEKSLLTLSEGGKKQAQDCNVFVVGSSGLCKEIENFGFQVNSLSSILASSSTAAAEDTSSSSSPSPSPSPSSSMDRTDLSMYSFEDEEIFDNGNGIDAIIVGLDTDFTYRKLCIVTSLLQRHPDAVFVATNEDAFDVVDGKINNDKRNLPGNGSIVKSIEIASERKAINVGKPSPILVELMQNEFDFEFERTLMVGDRLDTDVKFAKDGGMKSALVLTGCTTVEKLMDVGVGSEEEPLPNIIFPHMGMMMLSDK